MRTCYIDGLTNSIADLVQPGELTEHWTISRINVPDAHRGKGVGSRLLDQICIDADREQVPLQLTVLASGPLDRDDLIAWYERRGFQEITKTGYYRRNPRS